jgi:hypothetical protein
MTFKPPISLSKSLLLQRLEVLNQLWNENFIPRDLQRHYFLYWFVVYQCNIIQTSRALKIHRNTIQGHFRQFGFAGKAISLRHAYKSLAKRNKKKEFDSNFFKFYQAFNGKIKITPEENKRLIALWEIGFPLKTLVSHYMIWALRTQKSKVWFEKRLGYTNRHHLRLLNSVLDPATRDGFWLKTLEPRHAEIFSRRHENSFLKIKR